MRPFSSPFFSPQAFLSGSDVRASLCTISPGEGHCLQHGFVSSPSTRQRLHFPTHTLTHTHTHTLARAHGQRVSPTRMMLYCAMCKTAPAQSVQHGPTSLAARSQPAQRLCLGLFLPCVACTACMHACAGMASRPACATRRLQCLEQPSRPTCDDSKRVGGRWGGASQTASLLVLGRAETEQG